MSAGGVVAGTAAVVVGLDTTRLKAGLAGLQNKMKAVSAKLNEVSASITRIAAPIAAGFGLAIKTMASFEDEMAKVAAVTNSTAADMESLSDAARKLGATTSFSASEAAEGMKFLGQAGFDTKQIMAGIPAVLQLARAGALDLGRAADIASDIGTAFGIAAEDIGGLADVLAATASNANTNVEMMGETFKFLAPVAKTAGQSLQDAAIATGLIANAGIKGSAAGTSLAVVLRKLAETGVQEKMRALGVEVLTANGNIKSMTPLLQELGKATSDLSGAERLSFFTELFDARGAKAAINIAGATEDSVAKLTDKINNAAGATARMAKIMEATTAGAWRRMMSAASEMAITIGFELKDSIVDLLKWLTASANGMAKWVKENGALVVTIAKVTAGALAFAVGLKAVAAFIGIGGFLIGGVIQLVAAVSSLSGFIATITPALAAVASVGLAPILIGVVAVTAAVWAMVKAWNAVSDAQKISDAVVAQSAARSQRGSNNRTAVGFGADSSAEATKQIDLVIQKMIAMDKTDKEVTESLKARQQGLLKTIRQVWSIRNALSEQAFEIRKQDAFAADEAITEALKKGIDSFRNVEDQKTQDLEAATKRRMIIRRKTVEQVLGIEKGLRQSLMELQERRGLEESGRAVQAAIAEDPTGALATLEAQLAGQRTVAESARAAAFKAIEDAKKASSNLTKDEVKALADKVAKEEEAVDRIMNQKLQAQDAVNREEASSARERMSKAKREQKKMVDSAIGQKVLSGSTDIREQIVGLMQSKEAEEQTDLQKQMVVTLDSIDKNTKTPSGGYV